MVENVTYKISNGRIKIIHCFYQVLQPLFFPIYASFFLYRRRRALSILLTARSKFGCVSCDRMGLTASGNGAEVRLWS